MDSWAISLDEAERLVVELLELVSGSDHWPFPD
jgi:hypothetical protein